MSECRQLHVHVTVVSLYKTFIPRGTMSPAAHWDLFLTMLLFWWGCQHELPSPLGIQRVCCHVCFLSGTRCCHGYLWVERGLLGKQVLFQGKATPWTSHSSLILVLSNFEDHLITVVQGFLHFVFSWREI